MCCFRASKFAPEGQFRFQARGSYNFRKRSLRCSRCEHGGVGFLRTIGSVVRDRVQNRTVRKNHELSQKPSVSGHRYAVFLPIFPHFHWSTSSVLALQLLRSAEQYAAATDLCSNSNSSRSRSSPWLAEAILEAAEQRLNQWLMSLLQQHRQLSIASTAAANIFELATFGSYNILLPK